MDRNITPPGPVWNKSARPDGTFSRADLDFSPGFVFASWSLTNLSMDDEIAGVQVQGGDVFQ